MTTATSPRTITLENVRLSFPTLVTAKATIDNGPKKFSANFIIDPTTSQGKSNIAKIEKAIAAAEMDEFGKMGIVEKLRDPKRKVYRPGEDFVNTDGEIYNGYEGMMGLSTKAGKRPLLLDRKKQPVDVDDIEDVFQGGYRVDAIVNLYCTSKEKQGGRGLFASVNAIRFREEDETFGGAKASADDFEDIDEDDAFGGDDDDIG